MIFDFYPQKLVIEWSLKNHMLEISQTITTLSTRRVKLDFNPPQEEKKNMGNLKIPAFFPPVIGEQNPYIIW